MARKFKNGVKVKVVKCVGESALETGFRVGSKGVVQRFNTFDHPYEYTVKNTSSGKSARFNARELQLV